SLGAWAIGMILWPGSKRACPTDEALRISNAVRRKVEVAGVFVNQSLDEVGRRTGAKVIKAQSVRLASDIVAVQAFHTDFHLLDTHREGLRGGTGETFDWSMLARRRSDV